VSPAITAVEALDIRFPTSRALDGSDAMNPDPDYSAAYAIVRTDTEDLVGHGFTFTIGRGNEVCCAAVEALARHHRLFPARTRVATRLRPVNASAANLHTIRAHKVDVPAASAGPCSDSDTANSLCYTGR
jgi:hypothetical protein